MSRYPPPRERSPQRYSDRRPSAPYVNSASVYRPSNDSPQAPIDRAPRGPKAEVPRGGYQFASATRGRGGFSARPGDTWDRERDRDRDRDRDTRPTPSTFRRDDDRADWSRRERERDVFPPRDRSGPGGVDRRDRSPSPDRLRRNSRENIQSPYGRPGDNTYYGSARGGSSRGRGRGDWERSRGRPSFVGERDRDGFCPRSRSREGWRDREYDRNRAPGGEVERSERFERREYNKPDDRDARSRDHDLWQRDRSPGRNSNRGASPGAVSIASQHAPTDRHTEIPRKSLAMAGPLSARSEGRRETDSDYFAIRGDLPRQPASATFPSQTVPQSSSLGLDYGEPPATSAAAPITIEKIPPSRVQPSQQSQPPPQPPPPVQLSVQPQPHNAPPQPSPQLTTQSFPQMQLQSQSQSQSQSVKHETVPAPTAPSSTLPPSGPKADRNNAPGIAPVTPRASMQPFDPWSRPDTAARSLRPPTAPQSIINPSDNSSQYADAVPNMRTPTAPSADRPLPANTPSGPRAISGGAYKARSSISEQPSSAAPPTAPRQPKAAEIRQVPNAPTGPRGAAFPGPVGSAAASNRLWVNPGYSQPKPSIMNQLNRPYQPEVRDKQPYAPPSRPSISYHPQQTKPRMMAAMTELGPTSPSASAHAKPLSIAVADKDIADSPEHVQDSMPVSDDDDLDDEDGLDEEDFTASEQTHAREMKVLESRKPLQPLQDPIMAALLIRIQLLGMIAQGIVPEAYEESKLEDQGTMAMDYEMTPKKSPMSPEHTPKDESDDILQSQTRGRPLSKPFINPIPTPPIDELPYLDKQLYELRVNDTADSKHEPLVFEEDDGMSQAEILVEQEIEQDLYREEERREELRDHFLQRYSYWRREVIELETRLREQNQPSPAPASPAPSATPSLPTAAGDRPTGERTRGARNTTDLDMQQAILMSQQSAREEEERREREAAANAVPNYDVEAVVPPMMNPSDQSVFCFEDTNEKIPTAHTLEFMAFVPPEDDFTEEEQLAFISAYCQSPKKWGKIADSIPSERTYQDCITHYYLTKDQANYKELWRRSQPKRRRGRQAAVKPRANNLISDLALNEDTGNGPVAVTDSGRPRRAAAPTFGDLPELESGNAATSVKRAVTVGKEMLDANPPKPARGRKAGVAHKTKKTKEKILVDHVGILQPQMTALAPATGPEASPQKVNGPGKDKNRTLLKAEAGAKLDLSGISGLQPQTTVETSRLSNIAPLTQQGMAVHAPPQVTSYWSVPELHKFKELVGYYGKDFASIANFLKTKSSTMIRNHYQREVAKGVQELEQLAEMAEQRKTHGEALGQPPSPVQPPKRRYDATPSSISRPPTMAMLNDHVPADADPYALAPKTLVEDFPLNSIQRNATGEVVAKPRPVRDSIVAPTIHTKMEEPSRSEKPTLIQKPTLGPPRGHFADDAPRYNPAQRYSGQSLDISPRLHVAQLELRPGENWPRQTQLPQSQQSLRQPQQQLSHIEQQRQASTQATSQKMVPPRADSSPFYRPRPEAEEVDKNLSTNHRGHSRNSSLLGSSQRQEVDQKPVELTQHRNHEALRTSLYGQPATQMAAAGTSTQSLPYYQHQTQPQPHQPSLMSFHNPEPTSAVAKQILRPESVKPPSAKRSNLFGLLNDDPPEPPPKRASTDSAKRSINTPPPSTLAQLHPSMQSRAHDDMPSLRSAQSAFGLSLGRLGPSNAEYPAGYSSSPAPAPPAENWMDKFDPRGSTQESQSARQSPDQRPYSLAPAVSQQGTASILSARYDANRGHDSRRSHLSIGHAPSPPQRTLTPVQSRGLPSGPSHQRGPSQTYPQNQHTPQVHPSGPAVNPYSNSSTPVQGSQQHMPSMSHARRLTIQGYMALNNEPHRDHESLARRDQDIVNPPPGQGPLQQPRSERDIYGLDQQRMQPTGLHHGQPPPTSHTPQPPHVSMNYSLQPSRTSTPPAYNSGTGASASGQGHYQPQLQQYQQPYQTHSQPSHPHQQHHQQQQQHHQQQQQDQRPQYGAPLHHQTGYGASRAPGPDSREIAPSSQHTPYHGQPPASTGNHYRGYSHDERERR